MKTNSYLLFALIVIVLLSSTFADDISKQETTPQTKEAADAHKVEAKEDGEKYGVNYGGGGGNNGGGGSGWGGGCHHGCCYQGHGGSCNRCCTSPEEAKAFAENQAKSKKAVDAHKVEAKGDDGQYGINYGGGGGNYGGGGGGGGSGWGGGCRHGCCQGYGGRCNRCCTSPEEAKASLLKKEANGDEGKYGVNYGGGGGNYGGGGGNYGGGGSGWGGGCRHGCCQGYGGRCNRCCTSPEEAKAFYVNIEANGDEGKYGVNYGGGGGNYGGGGSGWGGGCHHGCCNQGHGGSCNRCCSSPEESKAFKESQSRP
ncbi:hypothetical protein Lser_V15G34846 [Lactuca serriola]